MTNRVLTAEYPILPPSDNHIREIQTFTAPGRGPRGGRNLKQKIGYTKEAEGYLKSFRAWMDEHYFVEIQKFVRGHHPWMTYDMEIQLHFKKWDLLNKLWLKKFTRDSKPSSKIQNKKGERKAKSPYKRLDTLNRRKLVEDAFTESLCIDDSLSWEAHVVKLIASGDVPRVVVTLTECDPRCFGIPETFLED